MPLDSAEITECRMFNNDVKHAYKRCLKKCNDQNISECNCVPPVTCDCEQDASCYRDILVSLISERQAGFCQECLEGSKTVQDLQNMKKLTCESQLKRPECKNVPDILRPDCDNPPKEDKHWVNVCFPIVVGPAVGLSLMALIKGGSSSIASTSVRVAGGFIRAFPWVAGGLIGLEALHWTLQYDNQIKRVEREAHKRGLDPTDKEGIKKQARQDLAYSYGKKVYDWVYGDRHCYNEAAQAVRACGLIAGVTGFGTVAGGATASGVMVGAVKSGTLAAMVAGTGLFSGGLSAAGLVRILNNEYETVQKDAQKRLQSESSVPSATEQVDQLLQEASQAHDTAAPLDCDQILVSKNTLKRQYSSLYNQFQSYDKETKKLMWPNLRNVFEELTRQATTYSENCKPPR